MSLATRTREELEEQIDRYRNLFWETRDDLARDSFRAVMNLLEHELDSLTGVQPAMVAPANGQVRLAAE